MEWNFNIAAAKRDGIEFILVAVKRSGKPYVSAVWYDDSDNRWYIDNDRDDGLAESDILAWMPLPEPPVRD